MSNKRYPEEFKIEAVKQITERGYPVLRIPNVESGRVNPTDLKYCDLSVAEGAKYANHGRMFKALMSAHVPGWRTIEQRQIGDADGASVERLSRKPNGHTR